MGYFEPINASLKIISLCNLANSSVLVSRELIALAFRNSQVSMALPICVV